MEYGQIAMFFRGGLLPGVSFPRLNPLLPTCRPGVPPEDPRKRAEARDWANLGRQSQTGWGTAFPKLGAPGGGPGWAVTRGAVPGLIGARGGGEGGAGSGRPEAVAAPGAGAGSERRGGSGGNKCRRRAEPVTCPPPTPAGRPSRCIAWSVSGGGRRAEPRRAAGTWMRPRSPAPAPLSRSCSRTRYEK